MSFFSWLNICLQHTGYPVRAAKRVQLNMFIKKVNQIDVTQKLPTVLLPILWIDEGIELNDELQKMIKNRLLIILLLLKIAHYTMVVGGILVFLVFSTWYLIRRHQRSSTKITPLTWMLLTIDYRIIKIAFNSIIVQMISRISSHVGHFQQIFLNRMNEENMTKPIAVASKLTNSHMYLR